MTQEKKTEQKKPDHREVLYTIDKKGHRHWVYSSIVNGYFLKRRTIIAWILIVFYLSLPWLTIGGKQGVQLDFINRRFILLGSEFLATDSYFLFVFLAGMAFTLFLFTALLGRVWCGWACPETVFLEFVFRPLERLIEGGPVARKRLDEAPWGARKLFIKGSKYLLFAAFSWLIASTFLAYIIGKDPLLLMMTGAPADHPGPFFATVFMMGLMLFQFGWFREQFCTVLCPYARFQSVLMDSSSIVVGYDAKRGEPRGKAADSSNGDCVDCKLCVKVCPTGIDIRNGVQLECIACTCCIDACDSVMTKLGRKTGLIRYDSEERLLGKTTKLRLFRPRVLVYAVLVLGFSTTMVYLGKTRSLSDVNIVRMAANSVPYTIQDPVNGIISNQLRAVLSNKNDFVDSYTFTISSQCEGCQLIVPITPFPVEPHQTLNVPIFIQFPHSLLHSGKYPLTINVKASVSTFEKTAAAVLLGPE